MPRATLLLFALGLGGCRSGSGPVPGELTVEWAGQTAGRFNAVLKATHCPATGIVELIAVRGDTGVGSAIFLSDSTTLASGDFPVFLAATYPEPRPGAVAAVRWFNLTSIVAYEGLSGVVRIARSDSTLSGTMDVRLQQVDHPDTLRMTGRFAGVPLERGDTSCRNTMRRNTL